LASKSTTCRREQPIAALVDRYRWDYLLGSVHWVDGLAIDWRRAPIWESIFHEEVWRRYCDDLCAAGGQPASTTRWRTPIWPSVGQLAGQPRRWPVPPVADALARSGCAIES